MKEFYIFGRKFREFLVDYVKKNLPHENFISSQESLVNIHEECKNLHKNL